MGTRARSQGQIEDMVPREEAVDGDCWRPFGSADVSINKAHWSPASVPSGDKSRWGCLLL